MAIRMKILTAIAVVFILRATEASTSLLQLPTLWEAEAEAASAVLEVPSQSHCSLLVLSDGKKDFVNLIRERIDRLAPWGLGMFEAAAGGGDPNVTQAKLLQVVREARKVRILRQCFSIIVLSDDLSFLSSFAESSLRGRLLVWATRLLVVTRLPLQELRRLLASSWTFSMMNAMVLITEATPRGPRSGVYIHLPYSPTGSQVARLASWTPQDGLELLTHLPLFPDKFENFYGTTLHVPAKHYKPYWFEEEVVLPNGTKTIKLNGMDYLLFETVAQTLNFSIKVIPIALWGDALDLVMARQTLICPVFHGVLWRRFERFEFALPHTFAAYSLSMKKPGLSDKWESLYYPLAGAVWLSVVGVTVVVLLVMLVMNEIGDFSGQSKRLEPGTIVLEVVGTLIGENLYKTLPTATSGRIVLTVWLVFAFVIGTAYTGNLTAALTLPKYPPRVETIEELVKAVDKVTIEPWGKDFRDYLIESGSEKLIKLAELMELGHFLLDGLEIAMKENTAHMEALEVMKINIAESFSDAHGSPLLYVVKESAMPGLSGWPIPHDAPYKKNFDFCIRASLEAGLYDKWGDDMLVLAQRESRERQRRRRERGEVMEEEQEEESSNKIKALSIVHMQGPLMLLLLGLVLGTFTFVIEVTPCTK
ncbi:ionotropic receptor 21a-like [Penaeus vannamei]|uniref:ionotropic receptor 21a-like n=1 Tax=Penaeus vannamei TaxID=6689 RepID=UPI00387F4B0D